MGCQVPAWELQAGRSTIPNFQQQHASLSILCYKMMILCVLYIYILYIIDTTSIYNIIYLIHNIHNIYIYVVYAISSFLNMNCKAHVHCTCSSIHWSALHQALKVEKYPNCARNLRNDETAHVVAAQKSALLQRFFCVKAFPAALATPRKSSCQIPLRATRNCLRSCFT